MANPDNMARRFALLALAIVASWIALSLLSTALITMMHNDQLFDALNNILTNRDSKPVEHYTERLRPAIDAFHIIVFLAGALIITFRLEHAMLSVLLFIVGDMILFYYSSQYSMSLLSITVDWSIPEMFQYFKEALIVFVLYWLYQSTRERMMIFFLALAVFMLLDDSLKYHETVGHLLAGPLAATTLPDILKTEANYAGEIVSLLPLVLLAPFGAMNFFRAQPRVQRFSVVFCVLLGLLFSFGVVADFFVHSELASTESTRRFLGRIEDLGEMLVMSVLATYVLWYRWQDQARSGEPD